MTEFLYQKLSFEIITMKIVEFANSVSIDEPPSVDLHFLLSQQVMTWQWRWTDVDATWWLHVIVTPCACWDSLNHTFNLISETIFVVCLFGALTVNTYNVFLSNLLYLAKSQHTLNFSIQSSISFVTLNRYVPTVGIRTEKKHRIFVRIFPACTQDCTTMILPALRISGKRCRSWLVAVCHHFTGGQFLKQYLPIKVCNICSASFCRLVTEFCFLSVWKKCHMIWKSLCGDTLQGTCSTGHWLKYIYQYVATSTCLADWYRSGNRWIFNRCTIALAIGHSPVPLFKRIKAVFFKS